MTKKKGVLLVLLAFAALFVLARLFPFGLDIPFHSMMWKKYLPNAKIRRSMTARLIEKLEAERPFAQEIKAALGEPWGESDGEYEYFISADALIGLDYTSLVIRFDESGRFLSATVMHCN